MKQGFKLALATVALATVVTGSIIPASAKAEDKVVTETATKDLTLQDGTKIKVEGDSVLVVASNGSTTPAPDGTHITAEKETITTKDGKIVK